MAIILYGINSVLLALLAWIYGRTAIRTRASYPVGLFIFAALLLFHSVGTAIGYFTMAPYIGEEAVPFMSVVGSFELVGLLALLRITL